MTAREAVTIAPIALSDRPIGTIVTCHRGLVIPVTFPAVPWSLTAWRDFRDERVAIRTHDAGQPEDEAQRGADLDCIRCWLQRHPADPAAVAGWTGTADELRLARIRDAVVVLEALGVLG
jgi:hypothetical protein